MSQVKQPEQVNGYVVLTLVFRQEGRRWLGECVELGTATYGRTLKQVQAELIELVGLHLNALEDAGERQHFFEQHGIKFYPGKPPTEVTPRVPVDDEGLVRAKTFPVALAA